MPKPPDEWGLQDNNNLISADVQSGWVPIVSELLVALRDVPGWNPGRVQQIKEKFGGLRFYYASDELPEESVVRIDKLIEEAEARAWKTCETCGTTEGASRGNRPGQNWIRTECPSCRSQPV